MFTYCPTPLPDETLIPGLLSRVADIVQYPRHGDFLETVYGCYRKRVSFLLPGYLNNIVAALPLGHPYPIERLIREHTLFPFFEPFLPAERGQKLRDSMRESNESRIYNHLGISARIIPTPRWLRFCYDCVQDDQAEHKICYWHRVHQVPGVKLCPKHGSILQDSTVSTTRTAAKNLYISAQLALQTIEPAPHYFTDSVYQILLQIAKDAYWLLCQNNTPVTLESLRDRLRIVMVNKELLTYKGALRIPKFLKEFQEFYPVELLDMLDCPVNYTGTSAWPHVAVRPIQTKHPIQYLLVIYFLGYTLESFFALPTEISYFGQGPWPCLNPVCKYYRKPVIETYEVDNLPSAPRAIFACVTCGFTYRRTGPDSGKEDQFRVNKVLIHGPVWEASLKEMLDNPTLKIGDIAQRFNIAQQTLEKYLAQNEPGYLSTNNGSHQEQSRFPNQIKNQTEYRDLWKGARKKFPEAKVSELTADPILRRAKRWLFKHDREWYEENKPKIERHKPNKVGRNPKYSARDRRNRDIQVAEEVCLVATGLLKQPGKPVRITQVAIHRKLRQLNFLSGIENFPLTNEILSIFAESYEVYAIRATEWWAAEYYRERGALPTKKELISLTHLYSFFEEPEWAGLSQQVYEDLTPWNDQAPSLVDTLLPSVQKDWGVLDAQLPPLIEGAATQLKNEPGYPIRVTAVTIGVKIDKLEEITCDLDRLPQTAKALLQVVETDENFVTRVIAWVIANDPEVNTCRSRLEFLMLTGLQIYKKIPAISAVIDAAFAQLHTRTPVNLGDTIDWPTRDKKLALAIREGASELRKISNPSIRITKQVFGQLIDSNKLGLPVKYLIHSCLKRLPETEVTLNEVLETYEQFAERCLHQAVEEFRQKGVRPTRTQLFSSAHICSKSPRVEQIANKLLESLASLPSESEIAKKKKWEERDIQLSDLVKITAEQLKERNAPFVRVSRGAISRHLGLSSRLFSQDSDKLPKTTKALDQVIETVEESAIRRIRWVEAYYQEIKTCPSRYQLTTAAGLVYKLTNPPVRAIISEVLQNLASFPSVREIARLKRWEKTDTELCQLVKSAAEDLRKQTKPLVWINQSSLSRFIGKYGYITKYYSKLPKTVEAITQVVETPEQFTIRRIRWIEAHYQEIKVCPSKHRFVIEAGLSGMIKHQRIQIVVAEVLQALALTQSSSEHECER